MTASFDILLALCLGLGLAAATGLRAFLPLLVVAVMSRFGIAGVSFGPSFDWLQSDTALIALGVAVAAEFIIDKVPVLDSAADTVMTVVRPVLGVVVVWASFSGADPALAPLLALIAAPVAVASAGGKAVVRPGVTATTGGVGNPATSLFEDVWAGVLIVLAFLAPVLIPIVLALSLWLTWRLIRALRRRLKALHLRVKAGGWGRRAAYGEAAEPHPDRPPTA